ncbi:sensor histidine kinase [Hymenobacter aerophilus]|uniref:sensor histidine kinase n=1 Tax=Hymenobacter aerophilus TaxID=119644 RepID=UPI000382EECA|nr:histidine kinase [Hymenobacter aerophilus]
MRKSIWFYGFLLGLATLLAVFTRLTLAGRAEDFQLFPDAPFWLFLQALLIVYLLDTLDRRARRRQVAAEGAGYYLRLLLGGGLLYALLMQTLGLTIAFGFSWLPAGRAFDWGWYRLVRGLFLDLFYYLMVGGIYLPFLYQQHAARLRLELEQLEKEATEARLRALQQHVDPHFLFNNLNILAALIEPENAAAHDYVTHLASLYRYLVRTRSLDAVPLTEELDFLRDYQFLLRRRFGSAYIFEEDILVPAAELPQLLIPPGVGQELLTNALKHNLGSRARPLRVQLIITATSLEVRNARQPRPVPATGEGSGLAGLRARLALLHDVPVRVEESAEWFSVVLPLGRLAPATASAPA